MLIDNTNGIGSVKIKNGNGDIFDFDSQNYTFSFGDIDGAVNGNYVKLDDGNNSTEINTQKVKLTGIPSDSTQVSTGELWYNGSSGELHRKF